MDAFRVPIDIMIKGRTRCPAVGRCLLLPQKVQFARPVKVETVLSRALEGLLVAVVYLRPTLRVSLAKAPLELAPCWGGVFRGSRS